VAHGRTTFYGGIAVECSVLFVTVSGNEEGMHIARALLDERLAACVNLLDGVRSIYRWKGEVCDDPECMLVIKSRTELIPDLHERIIALHSYEVPEIIAMPITGGNPEYLAWVFAETSAPEISAT
jgi:periplasmic divalent cation tolerance protein